jgi:hypothetical protein
MHPDSITSLATLRHAELQTEAARERLTRLALVSARRRPGAGLRIRAWLGTAMIEAGSRLRGDSQLAGTTTGGRLDRVGVS